MTDLVGMSPKPPFEPHEPLVAYDGDREVIVTDQEFRGGPMQKRLLKEVTKSASC